MTKSQDVVVLVTMFQRREVPPTLQEVSTRTGLSLATVQRSLRRLVEAGVATGDRQLLPAQIDEFLVHGLRYVFPVRSGGESRGVPTSWAAPVLQGELAETSERVSPVWPHPDGEVRGIALEPIHPLIPDLALRDESLYDAFALIDALRSGDARLRGVARDLLRTRFAS